MTFEIKIQNMFSDHHAIQILQTINDINNKKIQR